MTDQIQIFGANEHNLKNVSLEIPRNKLVVFTGLSGSGKSSLAFDTIYAEGQRRYIESFSAYARQFLGSLERPNVEQITGLSPVVSIEQKTTNRSPRSTVGTTTEIYDFLRLLYARIGIAHSVNTGEKMIKLTDEQIIFKILSSFKGKNINILAPLVKGRKGHYRELFEKLGKQGYLKVKVDGEIIDIEKGLKLDRYKIHDIDLVVDRLKVSEDNPRIKTSLLTALKLGKGNISILDTADHLQFYSRNLMCPTSGIAYSDPEPNLFSFNSPYGACSNCKGLGTEKSVNDLSLVKNDKLSINKGAIHVLGKKNNSWIFNQIDLVFQDLKIKEDCPINEIPGSKLDKLFNGYSTNKKVGNKVFEFLGIRHFVTTIIEENPSKTTTDLLSDSVCRSCHGKRLKNIPLHYQLQEHNISEVANFTISELKDWTNKIQKSLKGTNLKVGTEIIKEITSKLDFLMDVGLHYLTLDRPMKTLSGGESQRIRLATQIGSNLVGILYILDEPSIGLHQRDNTRLIKSLKQLRDLGNSIIVVEHDKEIIEESDFLVDIGPGAGVNGGEIMYAGHPKKVDKGITSGYLLGTEKIEVPNNRRKGNKELILRGAEGNNLKKVNLKIPLETFTCITGVSGSGKSSLISATLSPLLYNHFYKSNRQALPYSKFTGIDHLDKVIEVDQSPIGRTPRSNPATYTGMFNDIRTLYSQIPESKIRGYAIGRFSFNVKGGRCEECRGAGMKTIEMNFLPDVLVHCEECQGKRYNRETLEVRFKGKSITDVLNLSISDALIFFETHPKIHRKLLALYEVGLGYITLGQPSTTLSGGEAQRVKLATELAKKDTGKTLYIFDEPTTGLHFHDIKKLLEILHRLVEKGNSVVVIEHNLDVIKTADHIIDLGPEGGNKGGYIVFEGSPEKIKSSKDSVTKGYLLKELKG